MVFITGTLAMHSQAACRKIHLGHGDVVQPVPGMKQRVSWPLLGVLSFALLQGAHLLVHLHNRDRLHLQFATQMPQWHASGAATAQRVKPRVYEGLLLLCLCVVLLLCCQLLPLVSLQFVNASACTWGARDWLIRSRKIEMASGVRARVYPAAV